MGYISLDEVQAIRRKAPKAPSLVSSIHMRGGGFPLKLRVHGGLGGGRIGCLDASAEGLGDAIA